MKTSHISMAERPEAPTLISLFAGAGGLDLGLEAAGFSTQLVNELSPFACETLRANQMLSSFDDVSFEQWFEEQAKQRCYLFGDPSLLRLRERVRPNSRVDSYLRDARVLEQDIRSLSTETLLREARCKKGEVFLVAGGPPCQPFSRAGKRQSLEVEEGKLFLEFVRVVSEVQPRWFLFENVKGLILTKTDVVSSSCQLCYRSTLVSFDERLAVLAGEQLSLSCGHCSSSDVQYIVERRSGGSLDVILREFEAIGYRCHFSILNAADFGAPQKRERLIIIGSRDGESFAWPAATHISERKSKHLSLFDPQDQSGWIGVAEALWPNGHPIYGPLDLSRAVLWVKNVVRPHDEPVTWSLDRPSPTIGAHQAAKLALAPEGVPQEQLARQQWHTLGRRQKDLPKVEVEHEYLSDLELLKLQTFPDNWYLFGTRMQRAAQIGNAVPPRLGEALGRAILAASHEVNNDPTGEDRKIEYSTSI